MRGLENFLFYTLLLAFISSFFSISVYEGFLALAVISGIALLFLKRLNPLRGLFSIPLVGHLTTITVSSFLFLRVKEQFRRLLEQDFFSLSYFATLGLEKIKAIRLVDLFIKLSPFLGLVLSIKVLYTYYFDHDIKGFWGGNFVIGNLLALPFFATVYLFLKTENLLLKILLPAFGGLFLYTAFLPVERSVILGFLAGFTVFGIALFRLYSPKRLIPIFAIPLIGGIFALSQSPKVEVWIKLLNTDHPVEQKIEGFSSGRILIAKGALQLVEKAIEERDYTRLLIGWGYGPQKQYRNLPPHLQFINEYESFVFLTEFINGGLINVIFLLWFYGALIYLTWRVLKRRDNLFLERVTLLSAVWVNMVYHLFTLFWVPINGIFYILLAVIERLTERER